MSKMPDQRILDEVIALCHNLGYAAFDYVADDYDKFPFVDVNFVQMIPMSTKSALLGTVIIDLNVWGKLEDRLVVSNMANQIFLGSQRLSSIRASINNNASSITYYKDDSTNTKLVRSLIHLEFTFY